MCIKAITNVTILTMDGDNTMIENGVVIIDDTKIEAIGTNALLASYKIETIIDGQDGILIPGMINAHTHVAMSVFRGLADDVPDRLTKYLFPLEKALVNEDLVYKGSLYGIAEMLLGGVTTFADMYFFEEQVALAAKQLGIRGVLGETIVDFPSPDADEPYGGLEIAKNFIAKWKNDPLITPAVAPHSVYTLDQNHLKACVELADSMDVPLITHVAEMAHEHEHCINNYGLSPVAYLDKLGALNQRFIGAHMIHISDEDIHLLKERGAGVSHNIGANAKSAKGVAPAMKMFEMGMSIGLGTDGPMSGNTLDIFTQLSLVAKIQKLYSGDRSLVKANEVLEMATIGGAKALHMDHLIGSIEVGKKADLVIVETTSVNMQPIYDPYSTLVYAANPSNVRDVLVNGVQVVKDKSLCTASLKTLQSNLKELQNIVLEVAKTL